MQNASRNDQVVAWAELNTAKRRFERTLALAHVHYFVALRVSVKLRNLFGWPDHRHRDIVIEDQRDAIENRVAGFRELLRTEMPMSQRLTGCRIPMNLFQCVQSTNGSRPFNVVQQ